MEANANLPPHYRRNFIAFLVDYFMFDVGMNFLSQTAVLPSLVRHLTDSAPLIGLVSTLQTGGWLLPQLIAASYVASQPRKKPYIVIPALIGRLTYPLLAFAIWKLAVPSPDLTLILLFVSITIFFASDGLASVPWFDLLSKSLPATRRGRLIGLSQMTGGITSVGAGIAVGYILGPSGPDFPANYATLFAIASACFLISLIAILPIKEQPDTATPERLSWRAFFSQLAGVMRLDVTFRLVILIRLFVTWGSMAAPFYVIYALDVLHFDQGVVGIFVSAQVIGGILSGLGMGYIGERVGTRAIIRLAAAMAVIVPLLALLVAGVRHLLAGDVVVYAYALIFAVSGAVGNAQLAGFMNYILEAAPNHQRPAYIGLANTLGGVALVAPFLGGWIVQLTGSYTVLFVATAFICFLGLIGTAWMEEPRHRAV
jgi:MFS family permease